MDSPEHSDMDSPEQTTKPASKTVVVPSTGVTKPVSELTPEEQLEIFENDLKENDWGHQPC